MEQNREHVSTWLHHAQAAGSFQPYCFFDFTQPFNLVQFPKACSDAHELLSADASSFSDSQLCTSSTHAPKPNRVAQPFCYLPARCLTRAVRTWSAKACTTAKSPQHPKPYILRMGMKVYPSLRPQGSKDPNNKALGPKTLHRNSVVVRKSANFEEPVAGSQRSRRC